METVHIRRWTRQEYEQMGQVGILGPEDRVELIEGEIIEVSPQRSAHAAAAISVVQEVMQLAFGHDFHVRTQLPLALGDVSMPEPDVAVVAGRPRDYRDAHPEQAVLVVEVSESSLTFDRTVKLRLYARSGVPEYWIVNLIDYTLEVYRDPIGETYQSSSVHAAPGFVSPSMWPEAAIEVADLLP